MTTLGRLDRIAHRSPAWLDQFCEPRLMRRRGVLDHVACHDLETGERRVVIVTAEPSARKVLDEIARLHGELRHPNIPALDRRGAANGMEFVSLRSRAVADLDTLIPIAMNGVQSAGAGVAFLYAIIGAIRAGHATVDPQTGAPICIGAFSGANVLISEDHLDVIGWGYPTTEIDRRVVLRDSTVVHVAWEASFGGRISPNSDLDAMGRFFHCLLPTTDIPPDLFAALSGDEHRTMELVNAIAILETAAHARDPAQRSWDTYVDYLHRLVAMLGTGPDEDALKGELADLCTRWRATSQLFAALDGSWFILRSGERVDLDRRQPLRRILAALIARRRDAPGAPVYTETLLSAGWAGERVTLEAGRNRVRVAVSTLRSMGLRDVILSQDDGYLLDPGVAINIE